MTVLRDTLDKAIVKKRGLFAPNSPLVFIMDSYGVHLKFLSESREEYARKKVFFVVIPKRLTGLLQPLDVAVNRSMQQFYSDKFTEYTTKSIDENSNKTPHGNIKMPSALHVTSWVCDWAAEFGKPNVKILLNLHFVEFSLNFLLVFTIFFPIHFGGKSRHHIQV